MDYRSIIKEIGRGKNHARPLDLDTARALYGAMLRGDVPEMEMGAILLALRIKGEDEAEMQGFYQAMREQVIRLSPPPSCPRPIVIPSYNGARKQINLTPLLALLLNRLGFPVVVHGISDDPTRVTTQTLFNLLGVTAARDAGEAQSLLAAGRPVFIPVEVFCPPLAGQLALRWRLGVRNSAHTLAKLASPFAEDEALRLSSVSHPEYLSRVGKLFTAIGGQALLLPGTEGEAYASPGRCPEMALADGQGIRTLYARDSLAMDQEVLPVAGKDALASAQWIQRVLAGDTPIPGSIKIQLACCLLATGEVATLTQGLERLA